MGRYIVVIILLSCNVVNAQLISLSGSVTDNEGNPLSYATIALKSTTYGTSSSEDGSYELRNIEPGQYTLEVSFVGFSSHTQEIKLPEDSQTPKHISLETSEVLMDDLVISGTMKQVQRSQSPVPVEVYTTSFFKKIQPLICLRHSKISTECAHRSTVVYVILVIYRSTALMAHIP